MSIVVLPLHMRSVPTQNYVYIVYHAIHRDALIVDPFGDIDLIQNELDERGLILKGILVTHAHFDHIGLVGPIVNLHRCQVWVSHQESACLKIASKYLQVVETESAFHVGSLTVDPLLTPGHTLGSICYKVATNLFTGDTLFIDGCGMCFGDNSDPGLLFESLNKLKESLAPDTRVFPGHRYVHTIGKPLAYVMTHNIYMQFSREQKDLFISFRMRGAQKNLFNFR